MSFTTQYAVMVNGVIYCHQDAPWMVPRPAVFDDKLAALGAAAALEQHLRETNRTNTDHHCRAPLLLGLDHAGCDRRDRAAVRGHARRGGLVMRTLYRHRRPGKHALSAGGMSVADLVARRGVTWGYLPNGRFIDSDSLPWWPGQFVATFHLPISEPTVSEDLTP